MSNRQGRARTWLSGSVLAAAATVGLVVGLTGSAYADPTTTYVAVGSDTTQDVMDQFAINIGGGIVGSWDAVNPGDPANPHDTINPKPGCSETRPNGSGEGLAALRKSINPNTTATQLANPPEPNCIDFSRSSSGPGANQSNTGDLVYIPFALDAVATATGPLTAVTGTDPAVATNITHADDFTLANVQSLYNCNTIPVDTVNYVPDGTVTDATHQPIHLYIPQLGSGTRNFWATTMGINATTPPACVHDHSEVTPTLQVQEHDGTVYAGDADGLGPFSIAQFIAQSNGHNDRRHHVLLHSIGGQAPIVNNALNTAYPITREVYNVTKLSKVTQGSADFDPALTQLLVGSTSTVCLGGLTIRNFGFATLNTAPLGHTCGQVAANLRAFDPATNP